MHQINCDFLIHEVHCSWLNYVGSLDFNYGLKVFSWLCIVSIILNICILFCYGEYTVLSWHKNIWFIYLFPFRPWPILTIKPLILITCFHVYYILMYNIIIPWPFQHMFVEWLIYFENFISSNIFQACNFHPFQHLWKYYNYYLKALDIWSIGCTKMIKWILLFIFVFKPLHDATLDSFAGQTHVQNQQTMHVTWQNIPWQIMEYFTMSNIISIW